MDRKLPALREAADRLRKGDKRGARSILIELLKAYPNLETAWYMLSFAVSGRDEQIYALRRALRIRSDFELAEARLEKLGERIGEIAIAPEWGKDDVRDRLSEADDFLKAGDTQSAAAILKDILKTSPEEEEAWYLLSFAVLTRREQIVLLRQALRTNPNHTHAKDRLAKLTKRQVPPKPALAHPSKVAKEKKAAPSTFSRVAKYTLVKGAGLIITVIVGVYLTILVANLGGYVDEIFRGQIAQAIAGRVQGGWLSDVPAAEKNRIIEETMWSMEEAIGLHEPFLLRTLRWLVHGLTLNLGETYLYRFFGAVFHGADQSVQGLVLQHLPYTLLLIGASNVFFFFASVFIALFLSRKYAGSLDRIVVALASLNSAPSWIYGIILIVVLAGGLRVLPFPKVIDLEYAELTPEFGRLVFAQMILPVMAIFLSMFFQGVFTWRTFFLIYSREDYVDMAVAKGLSPRVIERRYILRPTLPYMITNFAMMMIGAWQGAIALEILFYWPGIGPLFINAIGRFDTSLIVAIVVTFAYLLAITVFLLDFIYALVDPRVRVGGTQENKRIGSSIRKRRFAFWRRRKRTPARKKIRSTGPGHSPRSHSLWGVSLDQVKAIWNRLIGNLKPTLQQMLRYPSAVVGLVIIITLVVISIYTLIAIPYGEAIDLWQAHGGGKEESVWYRNPKNAKPIWVNFFRKDKYPKTIAIASREGSTEKKYAIVGEDTTEISFSFPFDYPYDDFPEGISLFFDSQFEEKSAHVSLDWLTPDGREIRLTSFSPAKTSVVRLDQDERLQRKLGEGSVMEALFADPQVEGSTPLKGGYEMRVNGLVFEEGSDLDAEFVLFGKVSGLAGTDNYRRDLMVALLWGAPVALAFGIFGAVATSLAAMLISAIGVWYGGRLDDLIQRITELNIILPTLPVAIMVFIMYSKSIWTILGVIVLLSVFGSAIKNYRAAFLQVKESAYIEGALAYGAGNWRIISRYMIPRILSVLIPQLVIMVPGYVFYEATLAFLGVSDPSLPTWGKVIFDALNNGAILLGHYYWFLEPVGLLVLTGLAFGLLGFALDRILNPSLRSV